MLAGCASFVVIALVVVALVLVLPMFCCGNGLDGKDCRRGSSSIEDIAGIFELFVSKRFPESLQLIGCVMLVDLSWIVVTLCVAYVHTSQRTYVFVRVCVSHSVPRSSFV